MKWKNAKEQLPKKEGRYIVYPWKYSATAFFNVHDKWADKWTLDDINGYEYEISVTHWMEMPEIPQEDVEYEKGKS